MVFVPTDKKGIFTLDKWLFNLGLWRQRPPSTLSPDESKALIDTLDFKTPYTLTGAGYNPDSRLITNVTSETRYDPDSGLFEDKITFWESTPLANEAGGRIPGEHSVLMIRGRRDPTQSPDELPEIVPDLITINGSTIFSGPVHGGAQNPFENKHRTTIDRALSFSRRVKEALYNHDDILDLAKILAGGHQHEDVFKAAFGSAATLPGLSPEGGVKAALSAYFLDKHQETDNDKDRFIFRQKIDNQGNPTGLSPLEKLKAAHGFHINTIDPYRATPDIIEVSDTELSSGVRFNCRLQYERPSLTDLHRIKLLLTAQDVPTDIDAPPPIELARLDYSQSDEETFQLEHANFFEGNPRQFKRWVDSRNINGFIQDCARDMAEGRYPKIRDYIAQNRLHHYISELSPPPGEEEGGEFLVIPFDGCGLEKTIEKYGDGIGGGIGTLHRVRKKDGRISEVLALFDLPWEPGGSESDYDGAQADIMPWIKALKQVVFVPTHKHFDHASIQYYAKQGWLRGVKTFCDDRLWDMIEETLKTAQVPPSDWPVHISHEHPDVDKLDDGHYAYPLKDEDGITRKWIQVCENGVHHSAYTNSHMVTGCYGDDHYKDTIYMPSDNFGLTERGKKFVRHGQLALARLPEVTLSKLRKPIKSVKDKFIALIECTNVSHSGSAKNQIEDFKDNMRELLKLYPDQAALWFSFSTNDLERKAMYELWSEEDNLRHSTALGTNSKRADIFFNKHGVDPELDLRTIKITADQLPQEIYDTALTALEDYLDSKREEAIKKSLRAHSTKTAHDYLEDHQHYRVVKHLYERALNEIKGGNSKPLTLFENFFQPNNNTFEDTADELGLPPTDGEPRKMPNMVKNALKERKADLGVELKGRGINPDSSKEYWMLRRLIKDGEVSFETKGNINETNMYHAIMRDQDFAALHGTHTADFVKAFINDPGMLGLALTGATGALEEYFSILSRYARGLSPMDDKDDKVNGYYLDPEKVPRVLFITQTPSMGEESARTQEQLIREIVQNRNDTVFCATREGFKVYNPKDKLPELMARFEQLGWNARWDAANREIRVGNAPIHIHGHGFWSDVKEMVDTLPAKLVEAMHIPNWQAFHDLGQLVRESGKRMSITKPANYVACVPTNDADSGEKILKQRDWLTEQRWLIRIHRKFGQMWGGIVEMSLHKLARRDGQKRTDGTDIRTAMDGAYEQHIATTLQNDFTGAGMPHSHRSKLAGPHEADMRASNSRPRGVSAFTRLGAHPMNRELNQLKRRLG